MKVGDKVKWSSQSQGFTKEKQGVIIAVIPAGVDPSKKCPEDHSLMPGRGFSRGDESYLIKVGNRKTLYWPIVKNLEVIE